MHARFASVLLVLAAGAVSAQEPERTRRSYDVRFLTSRVLDFHGPELDGGGGIGGQSDTGPEPLSGEFVVEAIRINFEEDSWSDNRNSIEHTAGVIYVTQTTKTHELIAAYLDFLRARFSRRIVVEADVLQVTPEAWAAAAVAPGLLTAEQEKALRDAAADPARGKSLNVLRAIGMNGQRVYAADTRAQAYVRDYDVEIAQDAAIADPIQGELRTGAVFDVRPLLSPDGTQILMETRFSLARPRELRTFDLGTAPLGRIELPVRDNLRTKCTLASPLGRTTLLCAGSTDGGRITLVLVRPTLSGEDPGNGPAPTEKRHLRLFDVGILCQTAPDFPGPSLELVVEEGGGDPTTTFSPPEEEGFALSPEQIESMIRLNVHPKSWNNARNSIATMGPHLAVVQTSEVLEDVTKFLAAAVPRRALMVGVESVIVSFDEAGWMSRRRALSGASPADADIEAALAAAGKGDGCRIAATARGVGLNEQRFFAWSGADTDFVMDDDVEIAQNASATDPVIETMMSGLVLDVRATQAGDGKRLRLEFRPTFVAHAPPEAYDPKAPRASRLERIAWSELEVRQHLLVNQNTWTLAGLSSKSNAGRREVLAVFVRARSMEAR